jgi:hypothetical protein
MEEERKESSGYIVGAAVALLLPIAYVLSSGPALGLVLRHVINKDVFMAIYGPLFQETLPIFDNALAWNWKLWHP